MKIAHMIKREDFYLINEKTLRSFYQHSDIVKPLYVYAHINAIVTRKPSKAVKEYLYTEYQICGSFWKKALVKLYCMALLNSRGVLASKKILLPSTADSNTLIYPCNRKYRVFDFGNNTVSVIPKDGFPTRELENEIKFRTEHQADFLPPILEHDCHRYSESIIDGYPVARSGNSIESYSKNAYALWRNYTARFDRSVSGFDYAETLKSKIENEISNLNKSGKKIDYSAVQKYAQLLISRLCEAKKITLTLSHGDLQSGNIWVERNTNQILIIDWESCTERSLYYDQTVLFDRIRYTADLEKFVAREDSEKKTIVLAEDLLFRLKELSSLPEQFGVNDFSNYMSKVEPNLCLKN